MENTVVLGKLSQENPTTSTNGLSNACAKHLCGKNLGASRKVQSNKCTDRETYMGMRNDFGFLYPCRNGWSVCVFVLWPLFDGSFPITRTLSTHPSNAGRAKITHFR